MRKIDRRTFMKGLAGLAASLLGFGNTVESREIGFYRTKAGAVTPTYWGISVPKELFSINASGPVGYLPCPIARESIRRRPAIYKIYDGGQSD